MLQKLPLDMIWKITRKSGWLGFKGGIIAGSIIIGGFFIIIAILETGIPSYYHRDSLKDLVFSCLQVIALATGTSLILGLVLGLITGLITNLFQIYLPDSKKFRLVAHWTAFISCFFWAFVVTHKISGWQSGWETIALVVACYSLWIASRLVNWIEDTGLRQSASPDQAIKPPDYRLVHRIKKSWEKDLSRYQIDMDLLKAGYSAGELDLAWETINKPATAKPPFNFRSWGKVLMGAVVPALIVGLVCWVI